MKQTRETGAALLTTLMIVAALAAISVAVLDDMRRGARLSANAGSLAQAQWYAIGAESFVRMTAADLVSGVLPRTALAGPPRTVAFPLDHGMMQIAVRDASTCINLNSVVAGAGDIYQPDETGMLQVSTLLRALGLPGTQADELVSALTAWIDTSGPALASNDAPYRRLKPGYITGREPLAEISELRTIQGFTPDIIARLKPWVCALPMVGPSRINLNALSSEQAPILSAALEGKLSESDARDVIARRPPEGWQSIGEVFSGADMVSLSLPQTAIEALTLETRALRLDVLVTHLDAEVTMSGLFVRSGSEFVTTARRWTEDE